ncbi:MAG: hypothetical protein L3K26_02555 [Candidatus Hydrogenedentes bacterium]|nr:hypothetical protein [Candidatus Hydrogenedentota bacterium]
MLTENQLQKVKSLQGKSLLAAIGGLIVAIGWGFLNGSMFQGLLIGYLLIFALGVSSLALVMLHHLCGGSWSFVAQRIAEAGSRTLPFLALVGALVMGGALMFSTVFPWANAEFLNIEENHLIKYMSHEKEAFLNIKTFAICFVGYFAVWIGFMLAFNGWSKKLDDTGDPKYISKMKIWAGFGCVFYVLTMTFAATHWAMSTDPTFFSTIYGAWMIAGGALSMMCFCVIMLTWLSDEGPLAEKVSPQIYHHFGNFMLGFTIFWSYLSFSPFLIIWYGNLPEEIGWYLHRSGGGLAAMTVVLIVGVWFTPMYLLMMRNNKTNPNKLRKIAFYILATRVVDMYWNIAPSFENNHNTIGWGTVVSTLGAVAGIGGLWLWVFLNELKKRPILPQQDPREELMFLKEKAHNHG